MNTILKESVSSLSSPAKYDIGEGVVTVNWVLVLSSCDNGQKATLHESKGHKPGAEIENIELIFDPKYDGIFKVNIYLEDSSSDKFLFNENNPVYQTGWAGCTSLISVSKNRKELTLCYRCAVEENATLIFNLSNLDQSFTSRDPGVAIRKKTD